jgi:hypothetical protein
VGQRLGSLIGAVGGLLFVLINAGPLGGVLSAVLRIVAVSLFAAVIWFAVWRTRADPAGPRPPAQAWRTYWICVAFEVLAIPVGAQVLARVVQRPELTLVWVVFILGVHFLPFARAFRAPVFNALGLSLIGIAVVGAVVTLLTSAVAAAVTGVVAGFVLLGFSAGFSVVQRRMLSGR